MKHAGQVDRDRPVPGLGGRFVERRPHAHPCVGHDDVRRSAARECRVDGRTVGDIYGAAVPSKRPRNFLRVLAFQIENPELRAARREHARRGQANPVRAAGHYRHFSIEIERHLILVAQAPITGSIPFSRSPHRVAFRAGHSNANCETFKTRML